MAGNISTQDSHTRAIRLRRRRTRQRTQPWKGDSECNDDYVVTMRQLGLHRPSRASQRQLTRQQRLGPIAGLAFDFKDARSDGCRSTAHAATALEAAMGCTEGSTGRLQQD